MKHVKLFFIAFVVLGAFAHAQQKTDYSKEPGYYDFKELIKIIDAEPTTEIYLEEPMLKMIAKMADNKKEGIGKVIDGLKLVRVYEYILEQKEFTVLESTLESIDRALLAKQWDRIIRTKRKNSYDNVYVHRDQNGEFAGLVITSAHSSTGEKTEKTGGKVTFVNIVGKVDLSSLGAISKQFKIPGLGKSKDKENK